MKLQTMMIALAAGAVSAGELVVSPNGMTPAEAVAKITEARTAGDKTLWTVKVQKGLYPLAQTLVFTPALSNTKWVGEDGAVISGGAAISGWRDTGKGWWEAPLPLGADNKPAYFEQLWVNGRRAERARLPNTGYFNIAKPEIKEVDKKFVEHCTITNGIEVLAKLPADEMQFAQMGVIHKWSFARRILRGFNAETGEVTTWDKSMRKGWSLWNTKETLVFFENVRSAFDAPGEWFYDAKAAKVLYRPQAGEELSKVQIVAPSAGLTKLIEFKGNCDKGEYVSNVSFENITFAATGNKEPTEMQQLQAAIGSDGTITLEAARGVNFNRCTVRNTCNYAMRFNDGCTSNAVTRCVLEDVGAGGVWMGSRNGTVAKGDTLMRRVITNLSPHSVAFNRIEDCVIRGGGRFNPEGTGVAITHCSDSKVLHNEIYDFFYTGVSVGWTWGFHGSVAQRNEIAFNKIYDLGKGWMSDMGGVYTLGTSYGTTVHDNIVHDVWAYSYGGWALYCDEGSEGIIMERNLCWNTTDGGFHQHYGTGCIIRNNIFAWNAKLGAVRMQRRLVQNIPCSLHFINNIVVVREGPLVGRGVRGVGGVWANNLWYDFSGKKPDMDGLDWDEWRKCGKESGGMYADPMFCDAEHFNFCLKGDSPAFKTGFQIWDYYAAGVRK